MAYAEGGVGPTTTTLEGAVAVGGGDAVVVGVGVAGPGVGGADVETGGVVAEEVGVGVADAATLIGGTVTTQKTP